LVSAEDINGSKGKGVAFSSHKIEKSVVLLTYYDEDYVMTNHVKDLAVTIYVNVLQRLLLI
jgi:hypothetical protein